MTFSVKSWLDSSFIKGGVNGTVTLQKLSRLHPKPDHPDLNDHSAVCNQCNTPINRSAVKRKLSSSYFSGEETKPNTRGELRYTSISLSPESK